MAWFTFGPDGKPIWYTGNTFFEPGDNSVSFDLSTVENGAFNGSNQGDRRTVGSATLSVNDCSELILEFDLTGEGLSADTVSLRRLFAGEIAGYTCRDLNSRIQEISQ